MRMPGLKSILMAAGLALAGTATVASAQPAAPQTAPADNAQAVDAAGTAPAVAQTPALADPALSNQALPELAARDDVGQPIDAALGLQAQVSPTGEEAAGFHNAILMPIITVISLLVLALLLIAMVRFRQARNPVPSKTSHNTTIEVIWTVVPVLILVFIAIPSIKLLAHQYRPAPDNAVTLKAIGNQWYWSYEYPDNGDITFTANMLKEQDEVQPGERYRTAADGPRLLATDNRVVLPVDTPIRLITTSTDVIHSWAVPAFWIKLDAIPGRLNERTFRIDEPGVYFGQCSELCGARHGFMPIAVEAVSPAQFAQWVRSKGGSMPSDPNAPSTAAPAQRGADTVDDTSDPTGATGIVPGSPQNAVDTTQDAVATPTSQSATGSLDN
ncbi:cytochrome c oxidase subunit II [Stakelama saccharophila]|uniref:Cytochrome c oxidase subunit 2 n=1 Tax=Stakelama saccharophila TaxID=3075605 RepID=A0ABZ0B8L7_9SPHN|nr:cytochrome c oxidase subunit II [Stakelama sp. W311]WNO53380.1 cytochrome c oxidase subunit II [Stakelama sp. W311]